MDAIQVVLQSPDGRSHHVSPGSVIGRLDSSPVPITDPRVSEAHALVSHRADGVWMMGLQGPLRVINGSVLRAVPLRAGTLIELVEGFTLAVVEVRLPVALPVIEVRSSGDSSWRSMGVLNGHPRYALTADRTLVPGLVEHAAFLFQHTGAGGWHVQEPGGTPRALKEGDIHHAHALDLRAVWQPTHHVASEGTWDSRIAADVFLERQGDAAILVRRIERGYTAPPTLITGVSGQLLRALMKRRRPRSWHVMGSEVWADWDGLRSDGVGAGTQRQRWDNGLSKLKKKLIDAGLVHPVIVNDEDTVGYYGLQNVIWEVDNS